MDRRNSEPDALTTALFVCIVHTDDDADTARTLLDLGADADAKCGGVRALYLAVRTQRARTVALLVQRGARIDARNDDLDPTSTALYAALRNRDHRLALFLLDHGATVDHRVAFDQSPASIDDEALLLLSARGVGPLKFQHMFAERPPLAPMIGIY